MKEKVTYDNSSWNDELREFAKKYEKKDKNFKENAILNGNAKTTEKGANKRENL